MTTLILILILTLVIAAYAWDSLKSQAQVGKYVQLASDKQKEIIDLQQQIEILRNTNKLLSMEYADAKKEINRLKEFNTILQFEYNKEKKND